MTGIKPLEKHELAELFGLSQRELSHNIPLKIKQAIEWKSRARQKIMPKHFPILFEHFYGTTDGWQAFFARNK